MTDKQRLKVGEWVRLWGAYSVGQGSPGADHRRRTSLLPLTPPLRLPAWETGQRLGASSVFSPVCHSGGLSRILLGLGLAPCAGFGLERD